MALACRSIALWIGTLGGVGCAVFPDYAQGPADGAGGASVLEDVGGRSGGSRDIGGARDAGARGDGPVSTGGAGGSGGPRDSGAGQGSAGWLEAGEADSGDEGGGRGDGGVGGDGVGAGGGGGAGASGLGGAGRDGTDGGADASLDVVAEQGGFPNDGSAGGCPGSKEHTFVPSADAYVDEGDPEANHGADPVLQTSGKNKTKIAMIRFDLAALAHQNVLHATLYLSSAAQANGGQMSVCPIAQDWVESEVSWTQMASLQTGDGGDGMGTCEDVTMPSRLSVGAVVEIELTPEVKAIANGTSNDYGWLLEMKSNSSVSFRSKDQDAGSGPVLVVWTCR